MLALRVYVEPVMNAWTLRVVVRDLDRPIGERAVMSRVYQVQLSTEPDLDDELGTLLEVLTQWAERMTARPAVRTSLRFTAPD